MQILCWCHGCLCGYGFHHLAERYLVTVHHLGDFLICFVGVLFSQVCPLAGVVGFLLEPGEIVFGDDVFPHCPRDVESFEHVDGWHVEGVEEEYFLRVVVFFVLVPSASVPVGLVFGVGFPAYFVQTFGHVVG